MLALVALLGGLFVMFKPGPNDSHAGVGVSTVAPPAPAPAPMPESSGSIPASSSVGMTTTPVAASLVASTDLAAVTPASPAPQDPPAIELVVAKGRLASGPTVVKVKQGDRIHLAVTSDAADELHLHGYDLHLHLKPGQRASLEFVANKSGRFTYELHRTDLELGALEVYPR